MDEETLPRIILAGELHYAKLWLVCVALRGVSWDNMPFEQRELAFQGRDAASNCLSNLLNSAIYRAALRYAIPGSLVPAAFSALFLLKMVHLFPADLDAVSITAEVEQLAQLLNDVAANRYALTLRAMLANLRRKAGLATGDTSDGSHQMLNAPPLPGDDVTEGSQSTEDAFQRSTVAAPFTAEELGFNLPPEWGQIGPLDLPVWIREQSLTDLGLPVDGSDSVFLRLGDRNAIFEAR